jgi:large subunit ribosomal protein L9
VNVILLEPVYKLGDAGELVRVKPGYARNFLVPQGLALPATKANRAVLDAVLARRALQLSERKSDAERLRDLLGDKPVVIQVRAGDGRIYGSVSNRDIAEALASTYGIEIDRRRIDLAEPIKMLGEYVVPYRPHPEVEIPLNVEVTGEEEA